MSSAIVVHELGGPEKLRFEDVPEQTPAAGEARIRQTAIGLNFIDVYFRTGLYKAPSLPFVPGQEGAGVVEAVGPGVTELAVGDRVAYAGVQRRPTPRCGSSPAARLVRLPPGIDDRTAAAMMLKGMTAEFLLLRCARAARGDTILFHAAAGGVGSIACQWAQALGLRVIGTAGGPDKVARARANGCDEVIDYPSEDIVARVKELTGGAGVRGGVRLRRQGDVRRLARLPGAARDAGAVRPVVGRRAADRSGAAGAPRVAVRHAPVVLPLRGDARRAGPVGGAPVRSGGGGARCGSTSGRPTRCATRRRRTAISRGARRPVRPCSCLERPTRFR